MKLKRFMAAALSAVVLGALLVACGGGASGSTGTGGSGSTGTGGSGSTGGTPSGEGQVYFLNFKPEQDEAYQAIAKEYTELTGVPVKVITAASGTYEQQLRSEIAKSDAPTIFQVNGPVGYANWKDYTADLSGSELYSHLGDKSMAITGDDGGVYGIPFAIEGYGLIVNTKIMQAYFESTDPKATSLEEINSFAKLQEVAEDMTAKKAEIGIEGVFASTSLMPGEDWRWQTHLMNVPMYYEWTNNDIDYNDEAQIETISFEYNENFQNLFDLYLNNSTVTAAMTGGKTVNDSMAEFALGQAAMVQNGNWAYGQISEVSGNTVNAEDVAFLPIYVGADGEEGQGICIGSENFYCVNKNASEADQQASLDFLAWLYTSDAGVAHVTNDLGFIAPFDTFTGDAAPADPLGQQVVEWNNRSDVKNIPWVFSVFPSQKFKDDFGGNLLLYAQGQMEWSDVVDATVSGWATEMAA